MMMTYGMSEEEKDRILYNKIAGEYARKDLVVSSSLAREYGLISSMETVLKELPNLGHFVEVGCGVGASASYLAGFYTKYIGIDQSEEMIEKARIFNKNNPNVEFIAENIKSNTLSQNVADVIYSGSSFHHMTELDEVMRSLRRIAKPDAFLVANEPQNCNPFISILRFLRGIVDKSYSRDQISFSPKHLKNLFVKHGLADLSVEFKGFFTTPFAQVILKPQSLMVPLTKLAIAMDRRLNNHLPHPWRKLSFDVVITGKFLKNAQ